jgi:hypothetical protein
MGLFDKVKKALSEVDKASSPKTAKTSNTQKEFEFGEDFFHQIRSVVENSNFDVDAPRVLALDDEYHFFDVVGESNYQESLSNLSRGKSIDERGWFSGFLMPEPTNEFDKNAVAVYIIDKRATPNEAVLVGYLPKTLAKVVQPRIMKLLVTTNRMIPILIKIAGGEEGKPFAVWARAWTKLVLP